MEIKAKLLQALEGTPFHDWTEIVTSLPPHELANAEALIPLFQKYKGVKLRHVTREDHETIQRTGDLLSIRQTQLLEKKLKGRVKQLKRFQSK